METKTQYGFTFSLMSNDKLNHWKVQFYFDAKSKLGIQLQEFKLRNMFISDKTEEIIQPLEMEIYFPMNFPQVPPFFRIIQPRLLMHLEPDIQKNLQTNLNQNHNASPQDRANLTVSGLLETNKHTADSIDLIQLFQSIRKFCADAEVEMNASTEPFCHSTLGGFWEEYQAVSSQKSGKGNIEHSGKIILPQSALIALSSFDLENSHRKTTERNSLFSSTGSTNPMIFEISFLGKRTFVGVEEFTAPENHFICPNWILENLQAKEGSLIQVRR